MPYIKKIINFKNLLWDEAISLLVEKIKALNPDEIGGHIGDLVNLENALSFKKFFTVIKSNNLEFREKIFL